MIIVDVKDIPSKEQVLLINTEDPVPVYNNFIKLRDFCEEQEGIGISAVQVGLPLNLFLVKGSGRCPLIPEGEYGCFVNCRYEPVGTSTIDSLEGCLSLRDDVGRLRSFQVKRHLRIKLIGYKLVVGESIGFEPIDCELTTGQDGIVFQHEIDHHFGILISDIGRELFVW